MVRDGPSAHFTSIDTIQFERDRSISGQLRSDFKILKADVLHKGSQLKLLLTLDGNQLAVLKPGRFERDYIIPGNGKGFTFVPF